MNKKILITGLVGLMTVMSVMATSSCSILEKIPGVNDFLDQIPGVGHKHVVTLVEGTEATCTEDGTKDYYTCNECKTLFADAEGKVTIVKPEVIEKLGHTEEVVAGKAATCTEAGLTEGKKCSVCGEVLVAQEEIAALGHTEEVVAGKAATCMEAGLTEGKKCSVCGETTVAQEEIPATGHTEEVVAGKAATCTETGLTEGKKCSVCGETLVAQETIPATGHTWVWVTDKEATYTETGLKHQECICGAKQAENTEIPVKDHEHNYEGNVTKDPTCMEKGVETFTCSVCFDTYTNEIPATGHKEVVVPGNAATCTEAGLTEGKKCSVCGETTVAQEEIAALGHTEEVVAGKEATCSQTGLTEGKKCSVCGETTVEQEEISMAKHNYTYEMTQAPTFESKGELTATCANDATHQEKVSIPSLADTKAYTYEVIKDINVRDEQAGEVKCTLKDQSYGNIEVTAELNKGILFEGKTYSLVNLPAELKAGVTAVYDWEAKVLTMTLNNATVTGTDGFAIRTWNFNTKYHIEGNNVISSNEKSIFSGGKSEIVFTGTGSVTVGDIEAYCNAIFENGVQVNVSGTHDRDALNIKGTVTIKDEATKVYVSSPVEKVAQTAVNVEGFVLNGGTLETSGYEFAMYVNDAKMEILAGSLKLTNAKRGIGTWGNPEMNFNGGNVVIDVTEAPIWINEAGKLTINGSNVTLKGGDIDIRCREVYIKSGVVYGECKNDAYQAPGGQPVKFEISGGTVTFVNTTEGGNGTGINVSGNGTDSLVITGGKVSVSNFKFGLASWSGATIEISGSAEVELSTTEHAFNVDQGKFIHEGTFIGSVNTDGSNAETTDVLKNEYKYAKFSA